MVNNIQLVQLSAEEWLKRVQKMESTTITPWPKVANNIFCSLQWMGKEVVTQAVRKYYGLSVDNQVVASLEIYYLSELTIRVRGLYCDKEHRRKGYMKTCLQLALKNYQGHAKKVLTVSTAEGLPFYLSNEFQIVSDWAPRQLEYFNFNTNEYTPAADGLLTLLSRQL